jgi:hypothetical protein
MVSLAELVASLVVSAMTMAAIYQVTLMQQKVYNIQNQVAMMEQTVEAAKAMMVRELDMAGYNPTGLVFNGITLDNTQLRIRTNTNGDGDTDDAREDVIYRYSVANQRILRITGGTQIFFPDIQAFTFTYIRADGATATTSAEIRQVNVSITGRTARPDREYPLNGGYRTFKLDFSVTPKNLGV